MDSILVVDADPVSCRQIETLLSGDGYHVASVDSLRSAADRILSERFHVILVGAGLDAVRLEQLANSPVLCLPGDSGTAGESGIPPVAAPGSLREQIAKVITQSRLERERQVLREDQRWLDGSGSLVARTPVMIAILDQIRRYALTQSPVWICGEAGTGKSSLAMLLHSWSPRAAGPFVSLAASGCVEERFLAADGGTLYVRDLDLLSVGAQANLLQIIQRGSFREAASGRLVHTNVRAVIASTGPLDGKVRAGALRGDLLACMLPWVVEVAPLRERQADIAPLAGHFLERAAQRARRPAPRLSDGALAVLASYTWPGNTIELEVVMTRAALAAGECVEIAHLALDGPHAPLRLSVLERGAIEKALMLTHDNRTQSARLLGISVRTLQYRLKAYGIKWEAPPRRSAE